MKCEVAQNRLLALSDPNRAPDELRAHVSACAGCRAFAAGVQKLDVLLASLPVPPSPAKAAFLQRVAAAGPVIHVKPKRDSAVDLLPAFARKGRWQYASAGLAAAVLVAAGWFALSGTKPQTKPEPMARKHDLLNKQVQTVASLAKADTPPKRLDVWSGAADDLRAETKAIYKIAQDDEMKVLTRMLQKVIYEGLLKQAELLPDADPAERQRLLTRTIAQLKATETETAELSKVAPPNSQKQLIRMTEIARDGRTKLQTILDKGA